jgi:hypothetical protein
MTADLPRGVRLVARLIPAGDRQAIVGDLLEDAADLGLSGARKHLWLAAECAAIAAGLSIDRTRGWVVVPPVRELAAGLALDGSRAFRGSHVAGAVCRALILCGSIATLVLGVELLVGTLLAASGFGH